jgi:hypothetical protein
MSVTFKLLISIILFVVTVTMGFLLSKNRKPYNQAVFNVHKLTALASVILLAWAIIDIITAIIPEAAFVIMLILAVAAVIALFVTGALLSAGKASYLLMKGMHKIALIILIISSGVAFLLLR